MTPPSPLFQVPLFWISICTYVLKNNSPCLLFHFLTKLVEGKDLGKVKLYVLIETIQSCNVCQTIGKLASTSTGKYINWQVHQLATRRRLLCWFSSYHQVVFKVIISQSNFLTLPLWLFKELHSVQWSSRSTRICF